jgi:predicted nucleic acid-binding protein
MPGDFFDTNVLVYIASGQTNKADRAERLARDGGIISVQVLNEIANVARRKMRLSWIETLETHETGLALAERYGLSVYDAMIAASALLADCDRLWSEDMQHGMVISGRLQIVDPFRETAA